MTAYRVFFSHGGEDTYVVEKFLKPKLEQSGASVFLDAGQLHYGDVRVERNARLYTGDRILLGTTELSAF